MKIRLPAVAMVAAAGVLAVTVGTAPAGTVKRVSCSFDLTATIPPNAVSVNPYATSGHHVGSVSCGRPLGSGVDTDVYSVALLRTSGGYKQYFDKGTIRGSYSMSGRINATSETLRGTITVTGGTGAFTRASGSGTLSCSKPIVSVHFHCGDVLELHLKHVVIKVS